MADGKLAEVTIVVNGLNLAEGTDYDVSVTATNNIGTSKPVTGTLSVPSKCVYTSTRGADSHTVSLIGVVVAILLGIIIIFVGVILYRKFWKNSECSYVQLVQLTRYLCVSVCVCVCVHACICV